MPPHTHTQISKCGENWDLNHDNDYIKVIIITMISQNIHELDLSAYRFSSTLIQNSIKK